MNIWQRIGAAASRVLAPIREDATIVKDVSSAPPSQPDGPNAASFDVLLDTTEKQEGQI